MAYFLQQVLNGVHMGALYGLLAFGYAVANGVLHRTNLAHGAVFAFAGQTAILAAVFGWQVLWLALPATLALGIGIAFLYAGTVGWILSRWIFRPLADRTPNAIVVATLGVALVLGELGRIASDTRDYWLPPLLATPVEFWRDGTFPVTLTVIQLVNVALVVAAIAAASAWLAASSFGRSLRALSDDPVAAAMCGIDTGRVFTAAIVVSALTAALAGVLAALHFGNISFGTGLAFGLKVLFVAAVGGFSTPLACALGGAAMGMAESLWTGYFPLEWRDAAVFGALIALLILRPSQDVVSERV